MQTVFRRGGKKKLLHAVREIMGFFDRVRRTGFWLAVKQSTLDSIEGG